MNKIINKIKQDPYANYLGIKPEEVTPGYARCSIHITNNMLNFAGIPHGGLIFSLADVAFSAAACSIYMPSVGIHISGNFFKPAKVGDILISEAKLVRSTRKFGNFDIHVKKDDDFLASFNGTAFKIYENL